MSYVVGFIVLAIIFIGGPLALFLSAFSSPLYLNIILIVWVALLILIFSLMKKASLKARIVTAIIPTIIYSLAFGSFFASTVNHDKQGWLSDILGGFIVPFFAGIPICYLGHKIRDKADSIRKEKYEKINDSLSKDIKGIEHHIAEIKEQINKQRSTMNLIGLMSTCGSDTSKIEKQPNLKDIKEKYDEINEKELEISAIKEKIKKNQSIIDYI